VSAPNPSTNRRRDKGLASTSFCGSSVDWRAMGRRLYLRRFDCRWTRRREVCARSSALPHSAISFYYARMLPTPALPAEGAQVSAPHWTMLQCWAFRVVFVYFILDALPDLLRRLPGGFSVLVVYWKTWNAIVPWFGRHVLRLPDPQGLVLPISPVLLGDFAGA
jgi:hypothetical protein